MKAILSADRNWGIGYQGRMLVTIPSDMRFFRETTMGKVVVMGRKTLETLPAGQPLKGRTTIILSRDPEFRMRGAVTVHSKEELLKTLQSYPDEDIYVAGGGEIYQMLLPYCDTALVTRIDMEYQADTFFPDLDQSPEWELVEEGEEQTCFDIEFYFTTYRRK
ncbi:MAG: dihydrofolate reductase [Fusicatenibacter sp.]|nr:dihydrofolate reductase [Fusicatenibacter sp.]